MRALNVIGQKFHRLTVLEKLPSRRTAGGNSQTLWLCRCDCGNELSVRTINLRSGNTRSCGCYQADVGRENCLRRSTHSLRNHWIYKLWTGLKSRCNKKSDPAYWKYGGRGITVCKFIQTSPQNLLSILGERPEGRHPSGRPIWSIDRIDNDGGYWCGSCRECAAKNRPKNVRWATALQQNRNNRMAKFATFNGQRMCIAEAVEILGLPRHVVRNMIDKKTGGFS